MLRLFKLEVTTCFQQGARAKMPLVLDYDSTMKLYERCGEKKIVMARIGYSDQDQIQGIVRGAARFAEDHSIDSLPMGIFSTVGHYILQQLPRYLDARHE
ncbi:uncharacterized protein METZ01_LOCUS262348, partial [marine metagenome]